MRSALRSLAVVRTWTLLSLLGLLVLSGCKGDECDGGSTDPECHETAE
jgi:hypothetical protein